MKNSDSSEPALRVHELCVQLAGTRILSDLTFSVRSSEFFVLVGPSGCGKTTLLRAIAGLVPLDRGRIFIKGKDVTLATPAERNIGMVFQDQALYMHRSVLGNLEFPLQMRGIKRSLRQEQALHIANRLGIHHLIDRRPDKISGGERQRVALGRALIREPELFLFDEPLSSVDATLQEDLRSLIVEIHRQSGTPALYVTHNQVEAWRIADRIGVIRHGSLIQIGTPTELYNSPSSKFVAQFIGDVPVNFLPLATFGTSADEISRRWQQASELGIRITDALASPNHHENVQGSQVFVAGVLHHIERLAGHLIAVINVSGLRISAKIDGIEPVSGQSVTVAIKLDHAYLFDREGTLIKPRQPGLRENSTIL